MTPYQLGKTARRLGFDESSCPYEEGSQHARDWLRGWNLQRMIYGAHVEALVDQARRDGCGKEGM